jgi:sulfite exporter TauE/SafE
VEILTGIAFGFVGSLHCIGMCGPIALALPVGDNRWSTFVLGRVLYNLGRVLTYTLMGGAVGLVGASILLPLLQQNLSIIAGVLVILAVLARHLLGLSLPLPSFISGILQNLQAKIAALLREQSVAPLFLLGILNGVLPCGFVYVAMTAAAVSAHIFGGMLFMAGFGFGTIPAMAALSISPRMLSAGFRTRIVKILPAFTLLVGILLIVRGLNLGIPFISPKLGIDPTNQMMEQHH